MKRIIPVLGVVAIGLGLVAETVLGQGVVSFSNMTVTCSSDWNDRFEVDAFNAVGLSGDTHNNTPSDMWLTDGEVADSWIKVALGNTYALNYLRVWNYNEVNGTLWARGINQCDIYVSTNDPGVNVDDSKVAFNDTGWTLVNEDQIFAPADGSASITNTDPRIELGGVSAAYLAIRIDSNHPGGDGFAGLSELQVYWIPGDPNAIYFQSSGVSNVTDVSGWATATVNTNLSDAVLVWDTSDQGIGATGDWGASRVLGAQAPGAVTGQMTNLMADTAYTWRFYGANAFPTSGWSQASSFATALSAAQTPVFTGATPTWNTVALTWQDNATHETGYILRRSDSGTGGTYRVVATLPADATSHTDAVVPGTTNHYQLAVTNSANGSVTLFTACTTDATSAPPPTGTLLFESFEDPVVPGYANTPATGWMLSGNVPGAEIYVGITPATAVGAVNAHGAQVAYCKDRSNGQKGAMQTTTNKLNALLQSGVNYTLSCNTASSYNNSRNVIELLAGTNVVAFDEVVVNSSGDLSAATASVSVIVPPTYPDLGQPLSVRLSVAAGHYQNNSTFDHLLLTAIDTSIDVSAPTPDPMAWTQQPVQAASNSVVMIAFPAADINFVEYMFTNTVSGQVSGWQDSRYWEDSGLDHGVTYTYRVKARDKSVNQNETAWSGAVNVPMDDELLLYSSFEWPIVSSQTSGTEPMGWEDFSTGGNGASRAGLGNGISASGYTSYNLSQAVWLNVYNSTPVLQTTTPILDAGLESGYKYTLSFDAAASSAYTVYADLISGSATVLTAQVSATTKNFASHQASAFFSPTAGHPHLGEALAIRLRVTGGVWNQQSYVDNLKLTREGTAGDVTAPNPDPMTWAQLPTPSVNGSILMHSTISVDDSTPVEYFFTNTVNGNVSGWQSDPLWSDTGLTHSVSYSYRVKARDTGVNLNETAWSSEESATSDQSILLYETFEKPVVTGRTSTMAPGWAGSDTRTGVWNVDSGTMDTPWGYQAMYVWSGRYVQTTPALLTNTLEATTTYTVSFNAAAESGNGGIDYDVELWAGSTILGSVNGGPMTSSQMSNVSDQVEFTTGDTHPNLGEPLMIRLRYISGDWHWVMGYDNVKLTAESDVSAPTPDPMAFIVPPFGINSNAIAMVASNATDVSGPVEYYFENTNTSSTSGWTTNVVWIDDALTAGNSYAYRVKARDALDNQTAWSAVINAMPGNESVAPQPDPMTFAVVPVGVSGSAIGMTATTAWDVWNNPVEYYFLNTTNGNTSGWISSPNWINTNLAAGVTNRYVVKARDAVGNETAFSAPALALTAADVTPPSPDPMGFEAAPMAVDGFTIAMTALEATDFSQPVQYYFLNSNTTVNSGWQTSRVWTNGGLLNGLSYDYVVKARDAVSNETAWSAIATAIAETTAVTIFAESFENPPHIDATGLAIAQIDSEGWMRSGTAGLMDEDSGFFTTPDGSQAAVVDDSAYYKTSTNITDVLMPNVMYTLNFNVASRDGGSVVYEAELRAGSIILGRVRGTVASPDAADTTGEIRFTAAPNHPALGQVFEVRLMHPNAGGNANEAEIYYDNVLLTARDTVSDSAAPAPSALTWVVPPMPVMGNGLTMVASEPLDPNGVQYFFSNTVNGAVSGWQDEFWWTESQLTAGTTYSYAVMARDNSSNLNETAWSGVTNGTVDRYVIFYEGFESPKVYRSAALACPGWFASAGRQFNEDSGLVTTPFGAQVGNPSYNGGPTGRRIETTAITSQLTEGHTYELTFNVGNANVNSGGARSDNQYTVELIAGATVLTNVSATTSTDDLSETGTLTYVPDGTSTNLGDTLKLRFYMSGGDYHWQPLFDNVRLRAVPPELPSGMFLLVR